MKIEKIEDNDIVIEKKAEKRIEVIDKESIEITWNNFNNNLNVFKLKNLEKLKIKRISKTSSIGIKGVKHEIKLNDIYSIRKVEDGKTGIRGFIYLKEFEEFEGEFNPIKFNIETDLKVVFLENKNKLCLIEKNNILFEKKYLLEEYQNYSKIVITEDTYKFYSIAKKILKFEYSTEELYFSNEKEKEEFYNIISKRILSRKE